MSINSIIKNNAAIKLKEFGFIFEKKQGSLRWMFSRKKEDIIQYIVFDKSSFSQSIRVEFSTSNSRREYNLYDIILDVKCWWEYKNEQELEEAIEEIVNLSIKHVIPFLDIIMIPDIEATNEMHKELLNNTEEKALNFSKKYNLEFSKVEEELKKLEDIIMETRKQPFDNNIETFTTAAAYIGELIKRHNGGDWVWDEKFQACMLTNIGSRKFFDSPLHWVVGFWNKPEIRNNGLAWNYKRLQITLKPLV